MTAPTPLERRIHDAASLCMIAAQGSLDGAVSAAATMDALGDLVITELRYDGQGYQRRYEVAFGDLLADTIGPLAWWAALDRTEQDRLRLQFRRDHATLATEEIVSFTRRWGSESALMALATTGGS